MTTASAAVTTTSVAATTAAVAAVATVTTVVATAVAATVGVVNETPPFCGFGNADVGEWAPSGTLQTGVAGADVSLAAALAVLWVAQPANALHTTYAARCVHACVHQPSMYSYAGWHYGCGPLALLHHASLPLPLGY